MDRAIIHLFGLQLVDPSTFFTDMILAVFSLIFYFRLKKIPILHPAHKFWCLFFLYMSISTFIAGFGHLLSIYAGKTILVVSWLFSGIAIYNLELTSINIIIPSSLKKGLQLFIIFQLLLCIIALLYFQDFFYIKINTTIGIIGVVLVIQSFSYFSIHDSASIYIISAISLIFLTSLIHYLKLSFGKWFNYNDISHIIMVISLFLFYKGSIKSNTTMFYLRKPGK
jgi:hypothetical protein